MFGIIPQPVLCCQTRLSRWARARRALLLQLKSCVSGSEFSINSRWATVKGDSPYTTPSAAPRSAQDDGRLALPPVSAPL